MEKVFSIIMIVALIGVAIYAVISFGNVEWETHVEMIKSHCNKYRTGTFDDFMHEFNKREWQRDEKYRESFFQSQRTLCDKDYIHASIIRFDNIGMMLDKKSFKKFRKFIKANKYYNEGNSNPENWIKTD